MEISMACFRSQKSWLFSNVIYSLSFLSAILPDHLPLPWRHECAAAEWERGAGLGSLPCPGWARSWPHQRWQRDRDCHAWGLLLRLWRELCHDPRVSDKEEGQGWSAPPTSCSSFLSCVLCFPSQLFCLSLSSHFFLLSAFCHVTWITKNRKNTEPLGSSCLAQWPNSGIRTSRPNAWPYSQMFVPAHTNTHVQCQGSLLPTFQCYHLFA